MATRVQANYSNVFSINPTAGNLLIVAAASAWPADTLGISDSLGHTWTALCGSLTNGNLTARAWYTENCTGGACTVTITATLGTDVVTYEASGCATSSALDATASAAGSTANGSSGNITVGGAGYLFGVVFNDTGNLTLSAPLTERAVGSNNVRTDSGDSTTTTSGSAAATSTAGARSWVAIIANFLDAGGGGGGATNPGWQCDTGGWW